jgi:hypothetical protein
MNHPPVLALVMSALLALPATPALAKSSILAIEVTGGTLEQPLRITDPDIVGQFNYWNGPCCRVRPESMNPDPDMRQGAFIDWLAGATKDRPPDLIRYEIAFVVRDLPAPQGRYVAYYEVDPDAQGGYFYLPRRSESPQGVVNTSMIHQGVEGSWLRSSAAWEAAVRPLIQASID